MRFIISALIAGLAWLAYQFAGYVLKGGAL